MKTIIIAAATAAALASSALARPAMHAQPAPDGYRGVQTNAMLPLRPDAVYAYGTYLGADPDPQVRLQLLRSAGFLNR